MNCQEIADEWDEFDIITACAPMNGFPSSKDDHGVETDLCAELRAVVDSLCRLDLKIYLPGDGARGRI